MTRSNAAHDLSAAALGGPIHIHDNHFTDAYGRTLSLRGLNVSGASKLPTKPESLSHLTDGFYEQHRTVTFVGRPFPLEDAHLHFSRLQTWGLPLIRLLVTWESIGHAGPDPDSDLDLEYMDYVRRLMELMPQYGLKCFVCAHQDVWSRFSGGSGAPGWTFEIAGLDIEAFTATGAAYVHGQDEARRAKAPVNEREPSGPFVWPSGYQKLAASTMATIFWAGDAFAPHLNCSKQSGSEEVSAQNFLQDAFIEAFGRLADHVGSLEACLGFEPINEPHPGLVNLHGFHGWKYETDLHIGYYPSLVQALALGSGYAQKVKYYVKSWPFPTRLSHWSLIDPAGRSAWLPSKGMGRCVWRAHGVWDWDEGTKAPKVLQYDYFEYDHRPGREGKKIEFYRDCYAPFIQRFAERVSRRCPQNLSFIEPLPNEFMPPWQSNVEPQQQQEYAANTTIKTIRPQNFVYAPHFYDLNVLFSKFHGWMSVNVQGLARGMFVLKGLYFGAGGLRKNYRKQIGKIVEYGLKSLGRVPVLIGEVGIPFDINDRLAFTIGDYDTQRQLMNALLTAMEDNLVHFTLWNYNPDNRVEYGDGWNQEDFSIVNGDEVTTKGPVKPDYRNQAYENDKLYRGGRVLDVVIRPYAAKIAGHIIRSHWNPRALRYEFEWSSTGAEETEKSRLTEFYIPRYHYGNHPLNIQLSDGQWNFDKERQTLYVQHNAHKTGVVKHKLVVEISDLHEHLLQRVQMRRRAFPPTFLRSLVPLSVDVWLESLAFGQVLGAVLVVLVAIVLAINFGKSTI